MELWWIPHEGFHFELRVICVPYFFLLFFFSFKQTELLSLMCRSSSPVSHVHFYIRATLFWDRLGVFFRFRFQFREGREILVARHFPFNLTWVWFGCIRRSAERLGCLSLSLSLSRTEDTPILSNNRWCLTIIPTTHSDHRVDLSFHEECDSSRPNCINILVQKTKWRLFYG